MKRPEKVSQLHKPPKKVPSGAIFIPLHCASVSSLHCCQHCFNYILQLVSIVDYTRLVFVCETVGLLLV